MDAADVVLQQTCVVHGGECNPHRPVQLDVSGLPCTENSTANRKRKYEEGENAMVYLTWAKVQRRKQTPILILENVPATWLHRSLPVHIYFIMLCCPALREHPELRAYAST